VVSPTSREGRLNPDPHKAEPSRWGCAIAFSPVSNRRSRVHAPEGTGDGVFGEVFVRHKKRIWGEERSFPPPTSSRPEGGCTRRHEGVEPTRRDLDHSRYRPDMGNLASQKNRQLPANSTLLTPFCHSFGTIRLTGRDIIEPAPIFTLLTRADIRERNHMPMLFSWRYTNGLSGVSGHDN
jgi:hypothetical protein